MNEAIKNMLTRVSVRKFTAERVEDEKLKTIVECAKASPTGKNRQMRKFTVVHNREKYRNLQKLFLPYSIFRIIEFMIAML